MKKINQNSLMKYTKYSLAFLWTFTGLTSIFFTPEVGYEILANANITGIMANTAIYLGGLADIIIGLWMITSFKTQLCCIVQVAFIVAYSIFLTFIDPSFWLHPFGPITKNIPIIVLIGYVYISAISTPQSKCYNYQR